ncbi:MAG: hypothetical protein ACK5LC_03710, partial [Coprobacillaceae bacterium]
MKYKILSILNRRFINIADKSRVIVMKYKKTDESKLRFICSLIDISTAPQGAAFFDILKELTRRKGAP